MWVRKDILGGETGVAEEGLEEVKGLQVKPGLRVLMLGEGKVNIREVCWVTGVCWVMDGQLNEQSIGSTGSGAEQQA